MLPRGRNHYSWANTMWVVRNRYLIIPSTAPEYSQYVPRFPWAKIIQRNSGHKFEIQATSTNQTVDSHILTDLFDFRKVFINDFGNRLEALGCGLITLVLATPLAANTIEGHGTIG